MANKLCRGFEVLTRATAGPAGRDIPFIRFLSAPGEKFRAFPDIVPSIRAAAAGSLAAVSERIRVAQRWIFLGGCVCKGENRFLGTVR